jgi:L-threonylcarbamoyladenylate synthase
MNEQIPSIDSSAVDNAVATLRAGGLVGMPTETVYGLAADAHNPSAVAQVFALKGRPSFNPLIVHVDSIDMAARYVHWNPQAQALAKAFWPGPLTLVLPLRPNAGVCDLVTDGGDTLAIRLPAHPVARAMITALGRGIAAPSANRSGRVSPTHASHVRDEFGDALPVMDGGACQHGLESTVLDLCAQTPVILRPGSIGELIINNILNKTINVNNEVFGAQKQRSPGMLSSHYAPSIPVRLNATSVLPHEALLAFGNHVPSGAKTMLNLSVKGDVVEAAANLFAMMRALDRPENGVMAVMPIPATGVGIAINDRLARAAAKK